MNKTAAVSALLILIAALALAAHLSATDLEFSRYNKEWTGTSEFFTVLEEQGVQDLASYSALSDESDALLLIIAPGSTFSAEETGYVRDFIARGNTVFIADETGEANQFLSAMGSSIRVVPENIRSTEMKYADPRTIIVYPRGSDPLLANVTSLTLNQASAVSGGNPLLSTTLFSWDDRNGNGKIDEDEPLSYFTVFTRESMGTGTLYVLSDPSIFINGMLTDRTGSSDNGVFIRNLLSVSTTVLVEQSHSRTAGVDRILSLALLAKNSMIIKIAALIVSIEFVLVAYFGRWTEGGRWKFG
jgi:hypothetical protein